MGAFEESTWWESQYPPCGQGVAVGAPLRTRDLAVTLDALPGTPKRSQGKPFDLLAADALIISPMKINGAHEESMAPTVTDTLGSLFSEQDDVLSYEGRPEIETGLLSGGEGSDLMSAQTPVRVCSNVSDESVTIADAEQSIGMEDALWAADVPNLPDIIDLGRGAAMEEADLPLPPLGMGALGDDGIGFVAFSTDPLGGEEASEEGENSAGPGEEQEVGPAALLAAQGEELVWMNSSGGWKQVPASHFRGDLLSQTTTATVKESPAKRARSCGALDAVCGSDSEGAGKAVVGTPRSSGKVRRVSETGKLRSPHGAKTSGPTSPRGTGKAKKTGGAGGGKRADEWDVEGPLPPRPHQAPDAPQACTNCATTNTPLWRGGPHGPKTLCNACGVRYMKSAKRPRDRPRV